MPANSGWLLGNAAAINDNGWITGTGRINGNSSAYLLIPVAVAVSGRIALEGVADLSKTSAAAPTGIFHIGFRDHGTMKEVYSGDVTLATTPGSAFGTYTVSNVPIGSYDVTLQGSKNLRGAASVFNLHAPLTLPDVTLAAGDANHDNSVDSTDFGILIGAFGGDSSVPGSGYDATADFNFDGVVDSTDFGLLIGEFNNAGVP